MIVLAPVPASLILTPIPSSIVPDPDRESRVVDDICALLHDDTDKTKALAVRWIKGVLLRVQRLRSWWFVVASHQTMLDTGVDIVALTGGVDRVKAVWCPRRLVSVPLSELLEKRMGATGNNTRNAGIPTHYAVEAGYRLHLWPAPQSLTAFAIVYTRPLSIDGLPDEWEPFLLDGVLGYYGQHFDRDALTQSQEYFEQRFVRAINNLNIEHFDATVARMFDAWDLSPSAAVAANSAAGIIHEVDVGA